MRFVRTEDLKNGMRIARPIFNKKGVLLYDRDSKLTAASIGSIENFGLIGIYVLDPSEPLPPMTDEEREFERTQTILVYSLMDELKNIVMSHKVHKMEFIANDVLKAYGNLRHKITFPQNIRSQEDYVCKHSINVAAICAMLINRLKVPVEEREAIMIAALIHDVGKTTVPESLLKGIEPYEVESILHNAMVTGFEIIESLYTSKPNVRRICAQTDMLLESFKYNREQEKMKMVTGTKILAVAETFDALTAMKMTGDEEPKSYIEALRFLQSHPDVFAPDVVNALVSSIHFLNEGTCVELSNGRQALVISVNMVNILEPVVLQFDTNEIMDLSDRVMFDDIWIVDVVKTMDKRYSLNSEQLKQFGLN